MHASLLKPLLLPALIVLVLASFWFSLSSGSVPLNMAEVWAGLWAAGNDPNSTATKTLAGQIVTDIRLPRTLAAFTVGALLALAGVIMQVLLRNPLADPYILGVSGGAAVGALSAILLGMSSAWLANAAFGGAMLSVAIVFGMAGRRGRGGGGLDGRDGGRDTTRLLLTGVVVAAGWGAVINLLLSSSSDNNVQSMLFWLMGDLSRSRVAWPHGLLLLAALLGGLAASRALNVLLRGDLTAAALGVAVWHLRMGLYLAASLLTAVAVTLAGSVGFVGLIIPHLLRLLGARDHRLLLPSAMLLGGGFLVIADSLARSLMAPRQLPVGVITALIGVPVFLLILHRSRKDGS